MKTDVVAVSIADSKILWVYPTKTEADAEAVVKMAVYRQGVEDRFFTTAEPGKYKAGDTLEARK